ncbi:MAG: protein kinase [Acidobacteriota bacterium]
MPRSAPLSIDASSPPFDRYKNLLWLAPERRGHDSHGRGRHHLFTARERHNPVNVLIKVTSKPGLVYERDLDNELNSLSAINERLPESRYFPFVHDHGRLPDSRRFLITSLFDEFPLATIIGTEAEPAMLVRNLRIGIEIARALRALHDLDIVHVDLNPMNVLYRTGTDKPVVRIIDFESSYDQRRHSMDVGYNPPTTAGYSAPEVGRQSLDGRSDVFSVGAVLYTLLAGRHWTAGMDVRRRVKADRDLDPDLRSALLRALETEPARRFASMAQFEAALSAYLERIWPGRSW